MLAGKPARFVVSGPRSPTSWRAESEQEIPNLGGTRTYPGCGPYEEIVEFEDGHTEEEYEAMVSECASDLVHNYVDSGWEEISGETQDAE